MPQVPAETFANELKKLAGDDPLQLVAPEAIWKEARKRTSPIHGAFDWNIQKAAEAHWTEHARALVRRLVLVRVSVTAGPAISTRGWWSVTIDKRRGYVTETRIMGDQDLRKQTIAACHKELRAFLAKYHSMLGRIGNVVPQLTSIIESIQAEIDRLEFDATTRRRSDRSDEASKGATP